VNKKYTLLAVIIVIVISLIGVFWLEFMGGAEAISGNVSENSSKKTGSSNEGEGKNKGKIEIGVQGLPKNTHLNIPGSPSIATSEQAKVVANKQAKEAGLSEGSVLDVQNKSSDEYGNTYYEFQQKYKGVPVYGAKALLEVSQGNAEILSGTWKTNLDVNVSPPYQALPALLKAKEGLNSTSPTTAEIDGPLKKVIFISNQDAHLAWEMSVRILGFDELEAVIIDAHNPQFLLRARVRSH
jgi:Zn-dependent metalloprotease